MVNIHIIIDDNDNDDDGHDHDDDNKNAKMIRLSEGNAAFGKDMWPFSDSNKGQRIAHHPSFSFSCL